MIELDNKAIDELEREAKLQTRSFTNYLEFMIENNALALIELSGEYKAMIDGMLKEHENGKINGFHRKKFRSAMVVKIRNARK